MFVRTRSCCTITMAVARNVCGSLFNMTLRQGVILIALHQTVLSLFGALLLLVAISHVREMQTILRIDMADEAERRGFYEVSWGQSLIFHEGDLSTVNQKRFEHALELAFATAGTLHMAVLSVGLYFLASLTLLVGAVHRKRRMVILWIICACLMAVGTIGLLIVIDQCKVVVVVFGSRRAYHVTVILGLLAYVYAILCVSLFAMELQRSVEKHVVAGVSLQSGDGERILLLDNEANSNLLSTAQIEKLSRKSSLQFV